MKIYFTTRFKIGKEHKITIEKIQVTVTALKRRVALLFQILSATVGVID